MQGCEFVFHVAADYRLWVRDPEQMYRANVEGTRAILRAAQEAGVRRVVYTSSVANMGFTGNGKHCNEGSPVALLNMIGICRSYIFVNEQIGLEDGRRGRTVE